MNEFDQEPQIQSTVLPLPQSQRIQEVAKEVQLIQTQTADTDKLKKSPSKKLRNLQNTKSLNKQRLESIEKEKQELLQSIKQVQKKIVRIKTQSLQRQIGKKLSLEKLQQDACKKAQAMIEHYRKQKQQKKKKRQSQAAKTMLMLKNQQQKARKMRQEEQINQKNQKRKAIQQRMQTQKRRLQQLKTLQKESDKIVRKLKHQQELIKRRLATMPDNTETSSKLKKKSIEHIFLQIKKHQKEYKKAKQSQREKKKERSITISYEKPNFEKNRWATIIQEEQQRRKKQQKMSDLAPSMGYQKRVNYAQKIATLNKKYSKKASKIDLPDILHKQKKLENIRPIKLLRSQHSTRYQSHKKELSNSLVERSPQADKEQKQRRTRQRELRKQNKQRIKKIENKSLMHFESQTQSAKSKYQNYLGQIKVKKRDHSKQWQKILKDDSLSLEQKYCQMMKKVMVLDGRAKLQQQLKRQGYEESIELYLSSINAKIALLNQTK